MRKSFFIHISNPYDIIFSLFTQDEVIFLREHNIDGNTLLLTFISEQI